MSLVVLVQSSMRSVLLIVSHLRSDSDAYPTTFGGGAPLTLGYAGCRGNMPQPAPECNAVVLVRKKDGSLHFCMDFHRYNACMKKDLYPLLQIQEALESVVGTTHFSMMDFKSTFWQVKMALESQQYTAFTVGNLGLYKFTHKLFGLCNTPVTFQRLMQNTLGKLNLTYCIIYLKLKPSFIFPVGDCICCATTVLGRPGRH